MSTVSFDTLKFDIERLQVKIEIETTRGTREIGTVRWMIAALIALAVANFAKRFF